jgi:hypothetical protein
MTDTHLPRLGAACGAVFAVVLFVAAGDGSAAFLAPRAIAGLAALALFLPFVAYLASVLRRAEGPNAWLAGTAQAAGVAGITLKIVSVLPALALHRAHVADGAAVHRVFDAFDDGATVISLFPLAVCCGAVALSAVRTGALPRWLGWGSAVTAVALAVNGCFLEASFVPGLLLFVAWSLVTSVHLVRRAGRVTARVAAEATAAA